VTAPPAWARLVAAALAFVAAGPVHGQEPRLANRFDPPTRAAVEALVDSARRLGLPTDPLIDKALEGASKRAPADRILGAVRNLTGDLALARSALGPGAPEPDLVAGAGALRAGAKPGMLRELRDRRRGREIAVPLAVLSDLVARGVPPDTAAAVVLALAQRGAPDRDFGELDRSVTRDIEAGAAPAEAAAVRGRGGDAGGGTPADVPGAKPPGKGGKADIPPGQPGGPSDKPPGKPDNPPGKPDKPPKPPKSHP
jgi:hypothetical protein